MKNTLKLLLVILIVTLSGCTHVEHKSEKVYANDLQNEVMAKTIIEDLSDMAGEYNIISKNNFYLFSSKRSDAYIVFLAELDESKYEIINIQIESFSDANFFVTFKVKE